MPIIYRAPTLPDFLTMLAGLIILAFWLTGLVTLAAPEPASDIALRVSEAEVDAPSADPL
ncbi:hypothetical protein [Maricaulis alexandrii]|uniref:hypothetical protein n=1 Tax=Maricaulis alexandrii TaxID=2570354 RepID=UPI001107F4FD|nr:hypothetical protein [Maricaulis alexandrii]